MIVIYKNAGRNTARPQQIHNKNLFGTHTLSYFGHCALARVEKSLRVQP